MKPLNRARSLTAIIFAALATLAGCSHDDTLAGPGGAAASVHVRGTAGYSMDSVTINAGQSVTWLWDESGHTVTSSDFVAGIPGCTPNGLFDSGVRNVGDSFTVTFPTAGTFPYYCATGSHCATSFESAVVVVQ